MIKNTEAFHNQKKYIKNQMRQNSYHTKMLSQNLYQFKQENQFTINLQIKLISNGFVPNKYTNKDILLGFYIKYQSILITLIIQIFMRNDNYQLCQNFQELKRLKSCQSSTKNSNIFLNDQKKLKNNNFIFNRKTIEIQLIFQRIESQKKQIKFLNYQLKIFYGCFNIQIL
ncbi:hypothetical protein pb186bvf_017022 [Paramecium bursaria]